jgi:hypothetical protein
MTLHEDAQVTFLLADYANADAGGKLNVIGAGVVFALQPNGGPVGNTGPLTLVALSAVPQKYANQNYAFTVDLHDVTDGTVVQVPSQTGQLEALRFQQVVTVQPIQLPPHFQVPADAMVNHLLVLNLAAGLPLTAGHTYEWRAQIDGNARDDWWYRFHVPGQAPGIVFGGQFGPANIPGLVERYADPQPPQSPPDDEPGTGEPEPTTGA